VARYRVRLRPPTRESLAAYWTYARPFLVTTPIGLFQDSVDRYLVGRWAGLAAAGYYHVARALWEALASFLAPPGTFIFTRLSSLYARRSPEGDREAREFYESAVDKMFFVTIPLAFLFWAFAGPLIALLYGASFAPATTTLRILVLAALAASVVNPYTLIVYALEQAHRFIPVNLLRVAVYLAVLWLLVPARPFVQALGLREGDPGAAVARLVLLAFPAWVYWRWTRELAGIPFYGRTRTYLAGFALMALAYHGALRLATGAPEGGALVAVPVAAAALGAYLGLLLRVHPRTRENLAYTAAILSPARFRAFLREGIRGG
jgi:O-antigen/teichoic acid export membrane protein